MGRGERRLDAGGDALHDAAGDEDGPPGPRPPMCAYPGVIAMIRVVTAIVLMEINMTRRRPTRSARVPSMTPPSGRNAKPTAKTARVFRVALRGSVEGKKFGPMKADSSPKTIQSYHSRALPRPRPRRPLRTSGGELCLPARCFHSGVKQWSCPYAGTARVQEGMTHHGDGMRCAGPRRRPDSKEGWVDGRRYTPGSPRCGASTQFATHTSS